MMQRHLKIAVTDWVYWAVVANANEHGLTQAQVCGDLIAEGLRARANNNSAGPVNVPIEDMICLAAGLENKTTDDMRHWLMGLGISCWVEDRYEHAGEQK